MKDLTEAQLGALRESIQPSSLSRMDAIQQQQMAVASRQTQRQRLQLLRNAQQAIERADYGSCRRGEEPIGYQRLRVRPEAPFCLSCQNRSERER